MPPREEKKHKWMLFDILDYRKIADFFTFYTFLSGNPIE